MAPQGTVCARNGSADATTTRLIALLRMTASSAAKLKKADQDRQTKLRAAQTNQASERADHGAGRERGRKPVGRSEVPGALGHVFPVFVRACRSKQLTCLG